MHGKIFISYRREDAPGDARGICDRLSRIFGAANVVMDVDSQGMTELGLMYSGGLGVTVDYGKARRLYAQAASFGNHAPAMALLGDLYYDGLGVRPDYVAARDWYEKATALGGLMRCSPSAFSTTRAAVFP